MSQIVTVEHRYAYRWHGQPELAVGDHVLVPHIAGGEWEVTVTAIGSSYTGPMASIICRAEDDDL